MSSSPRPGHSRTAAWRLSALACIAFAVGAAIACLVTYMIMAAGVGQRAAIDLSSDLYLFADRLASADPQGFQREFVREARRREELRVPFADEREEPRQGVLFIAVKSGENLRVLAANQEESAAILAPLRASLIQPGAAPASLIVPGWEYGFRLAFRRLDDGRVVILGESTEDEREMIEEAIEALGWLWTGVTLTGFAVSWLSVRRVLSRVNEMTELAASIGPEQLTRRLPEGHANDEIGRLAAAFNVMLDRIWASVEQMRTITGTVAHDLRSPLTAVRGSLEMAATSGEKQLAMEHVGNAIDALDQVVSLLDATLDAAEAKAGALQVRRATVDLFRLATRLVELYLPAAESRGIALRLAGEAGVVAWGDEALLQRAISNLLDNAVAHLPAGSRVLVRVSSEAGRSLIAVQDDGPGFPVTLRHRVWSRFARGPESAGSGLGLALVRAVAHAHGGDVSLDQPEMGGSVLTLTLPNEGPTEEREHGQQGPAEAAHPRRSA